MCRWVFLTIPAHLAHYLMKIWTWAAEQGHSLSTASEEAIVQSSLCPSICGQGTLLKAVEISWEEEAWQRSLCIECLWP